MGGDQAFIYLNVGISVAIDSAPSSLVKLRLIYKSPNFDGLPKSEEFEPVKDIEDRIEAYSKNGDDWYVGRVTVGGQRFFYIYTTKTNPSWTQFTDKLKR